MLIDKEKMCLSRDYLRETFPASSQNGNILSMLSLRKEYRPLQRPMSQEGPNSSIDPTSTALPSSQERVTSNFERQKMKFPRTAVHSPEIGECSPKFSIRVNHKNIIGRLQTQRNEEKLIGK